MEATTIVPDGEDHALVRRRSMSNGDRVVQYIEALALFPDTPEGTEAAINILDMVDILHGARLDSVEGIFTNIRLIFESFNIHLE